ncbi:MAG: ABC transporter substrate-binding protein [Acidimicrobiia bacterium]|nr:ABC transporter substrate-binding protein [Acidimicrobiia bacterium]
MSHLTGVRSATVLSMAVLMALLFGACTSTAEEGASTDEAATSSSAPVASVSPVDDTAATSTTSSLAPLTASARGVTEDTIHVGAVGIDFDSLRDQGLVDINRGDQELVWQIVADALNDRGGILGREVQVHYRDYDVIQPASAEAVCIELTQDVGVFAMLVGFDGPTASVDDCVANQNDTFLISNVASNEQMIAARAPWIQVGFPGVDRMDRGTIDLADEQGLFDGQVVAVHALASAAGDRVPAVVAQLEELGVDVAFDSVNDAPNGDAAAGAANWVVIAERLREADVTTLVIVGPAAFEYGQLLDNGLGDLRVISLDNALGGIGGFDDHLPSDYDGSVGPMALLPEDTFAIPAFGECVAAFESATGNEVLDPGEVPNGEPDWYTALATACNRIQVLEELATAAGPDLTNDAIRAVLDSNPDLDVPQVPFISFNADKYDGNDGMRLGIFDSTKGLEGRLEPLSELKPID